MKKTEREQLKAQLIPDFKNSKQVDQILDYRSLIKSLLIRLPDKPTPELQKLRGELDKILITLYIKYSEFMMPVQRYVSIGIWLGITTDNVKKLERKGLLMLKHPKNKKVLSEAFDTLALMESEALRTSIMYEKLY